MKTKKPIDLKLRINNIELDELAQVFALALQIRDLQNTRDEETHTPTPEDAPKSETKDRTHGSAASPARTETDAPEEAAGAADEKSFASHTAAELKKLAVSVARSQGKEALKPILKKYSVTRITEIPEDKIDDAYADVEALTA